MASLRALVLAAGIQKQIATGDSLDIPAASAYQIGGADVIAVNGSGGADVGYNNTYAFSGVAVGSNNNASYVISCAVGYGNTAGNFAACAVGFSNNASGLNSCAVGYSSFASGGSSVAIGYGCKAEANNSVAVGKGVVNNNADSLEIGPSSTAKLSIRWDADKSTALPGVLEVPSLSAAPAAPPVGTLRVYGRTFAGRCMPEWQGGCGLNTMAQPLLAQNKVAFWNHPGNSTSAPGVFGMAAPTLIGTAVARNVGLASVLARLKRVGYVSSSTAGSFAAWRIAAAQYTLGSGGFVGGFLFVARFGVSDVATVGGSRMFVGMRSSTAAPTNVEPNTLTNTVGVAELSSSSNLHIVFGGSAAQTAIDLGVNFPARTLGVDAYEVALFAPPSIADTINYRVERLGPGYVAEGTITAATPGLELPAAATLLCPHLWRTNNAQSLSVGLDICSVYIETDY